MGRGSPRAWDGLGHGSRAKHRPGAGGGGRTCPRLLGWALLHVLPAPALGTLSISGHVTLVGFQRSLPSPSAPSSE